MEEDTILNRKILALVVTSIFAGSSKKKRKWFGTVPNFKVGDLVLMIDEANSRGKWPKAIVVEVLPDKRGHVRRVCVRTADGSILRRDIRKLCLLEGETR